jgi:AcrR family transcriptional regulator
VRLNLPFFSLGIACKPKATRYGKAVMQSSSSKRSSARKAKAVIASTRASSRAKSLAAESTLPKNANKAVPRNAAKVAPRERNPEEKRLLILAAARRLFAEQGYASTSTSQIARAAGVSEGIVFHHFGNKQALLEQIAGDYGNAMVDAMMRAMQDVTAPGHGALVRSVFTYVGERGMLDDLLGIGNDPGDSARVRDALRTPIVERMASYVHELQARGWCREMDPKLASALAFSIVETSLMVCKPRHRMVTPEVAMHECEEAMDRVLLTKDALAMRSK